VLHARFGRFVELASRSEHGAELYDVHDRRGIGVRTASTP
jgi:hypothetical protein